METAGPNPQAVIFDLDGVLVTTDQFHFLAWKELADELNLKFDEEINHNLRGVSREESLRIIYAVNQRKAPNPEELTAQCTRKNERYKALIRQMNSSHILPGSVALLDGLRVKGIQCAIASSSKNCMTVLERTGLLSHVEATADGNDITASKPDPQVFLVAAQRLACLPVRCVGVEDSASGIESIRRAGMVAVGIGSYLKDADLQVNAVSELSVDLLVRLYAEKAGRSE